MSIIKEEKEGHIYRENSYITLNNEHFGNNDSMKGNNNSSNLK